MDVSGLGFILRIGVRHCPLS